MTDENLPAQLADYMTGLEDLDPSTMGVPRINVQHKVGTFKDGNTGEEMAALTGIVLGLIRQRVMWAPETVDNAKPMCKSNDAITGFPLMEGAPDNLFPWEESGFSPADMPRDEHDRVTIPCETCPFAQWTKGKNNKNVPPACKERFTLPVLFSSDDNWKPGEQLDRVGVVSFQGSGIKPTREYLGQFFRSRTPVYSAATRVKLNRMTRGSVEYAVPVFERIGNIDQEDWGDLSSELSNIRETLRQPPRPADDGSDPAKKHTVGGNVSASATASRVAASAATTATTATKTAPVEVQQTRPADIVDAVVVETSPVAMSTEEDDLPF
jgi:hypothetical protein